MFSQIRYTYESLICNTNRIHRQHCEPNILQSSHNISTLHFVLLPAHLSQCVVWYVHIYIYIVADSTLASSAQDGRSSYCKMAATHSIVWHVQDGRHS